MAMVIPPLEPGKIVPLPDLPGGISPAAGALFLLMMLGAAIAAALGPPDPPKKEEIDAQNEEDNKRVVKMLSVSEQIDAILTYDEVGRAFLRQLLAILASQRATQWITMDEIETLGADINERVMLPLKLKLKAAIRKFVLTQSKTRVTVIKTVQTRKGFPHSTQPGTPVPVPPENPVGPFDPGGDIGV